MFRKRVITSTFAFIAVALVAVTIGAAGCSSSQSGTFKVGVVVSTSGPSAPLGQSEQRSLQMLEKQQNAKGALKVNFIFEDDQSDPAKASNAVSKLVNQEKVTAVIGTSTTGGTLAMEPITTKSLMPQVCMAAGVAVTKPVKKWLFSVAPSDSLVTQSILTYLQNTLKVTKIAILHDANAYGAGGADALVANAPKYKITIVANESYGSTDTDMTAQLTKIKGTAAQALVVWGTNPGPASIAKNMKSLSMTIPFVGSSGIANKKFIELAGDAANGVVFSASRLLIPSAIPAGSAWAKSVQTFTADYKKTYNMDIDTFAAHGWDSGNMVLNALAKVGANPAKIQAQLEKVKNYAGVDGVFNYSATDHGGLKVEALMMIKITNGQWTPATQ